jgi:hypothetical protein
MPKPSHNSKQLTIPLRGMTQEQKRSVVKWLNADKYDLRGIRLYQLITKQEETNHIAEVESEETS